MSFHAQAVRNIPYLTCRSVGDGSQFLIVVKGNCIDHNVVMDMTFINVSCYHILVLAACVFKCQFLPQLMGLLMGHSVLRREGLYQVIGKICGTLSFQISCLVCKYRSHFKVDWSRLRFTVVTRYQHLSIGLVRVFNISQCLAESRFYRVDFCDSHRSSLKEKCPMWNESHIGHLPVIIVLLIPPPS